MADLLKLELKELFRQFIFRVLLVLCPLMGVLIGLINHSENRPISESVISLCAIMSVMLSTYGGLSISREFTRNTIRNKIVVGHSRHHIYLSKLITVGVIYLTCISLLLLSNILMQVVFADKMEFKGTELITVFTSAAVCVAVTIAITILLRTDFGALIPLLFLYFSMIFSGMGYEFLDQKLMDNINLFLPCGQLMTVIPTDRLLLSVGCALLEALLLCTGGYLVFRKADLN